MSDGSQPVPSLTRRGQALVLFALTLLLLTLMVLMTISFGVAAARRTDLNNAADAAAYSAAVETARTFNAAALLNRAMIAHYVTLAGVEAQVAYVSEGHAYFNMAATQFRMLDMGPPVTMADAFLGLRDPSGGCGQRTTETRDASYELWHADLFYFSPTAGAVPGDAVDAYCKGTCSVRRPFARGDGWNRESLGQLEKRAGVELAAVHRAIHDLAGMQRKTYLKLLDDLRAGDLARSITREASLDGNLTIAARRQAGEELNRATGSVTNGTLYDARPRSRGFEHGYANAVLGTRPRERLQLPNGSGPAENPAPLFAQLKAVADAAFRAYATPQVMFVSFGGSDVSADYTFGVQDGLGVPRVTEEPLNGVNPLSPGMGYSYGRSQGGTVTVRYADPCNGGRTMRTIKSGMSPGPADPVTGWPYETYPMDVLVRSSRANGTHHLYKTEYTDPAHAVPQPPAGGCHATHTVYGGEDVDAVHGFDDDTLPEEVLAFVLSGPVERGAHGLWGQPVVPVMLSRRFDTSDDPWDLKFHFGFTRDGADLDMREASRVTTSSAAGVAHYHRRGHLGEPANLLNPFWRATLQPLEIDHRTGDFDPTRVTQEGYSQLPLVQVLRGGLPGYRDAPEAEDAYRRLYTRVHGLARQPGNASGVVR